MSEKELKCGKNEKSKCERAREKECEAKQSKKQKLQSRFSSLQLKWQIFRRISQPTKLRLAKLDFLVLKGRGAVTFDPSL